MGRHSSRALSHRPELSQHFFRDPVLVRRLISQLTISTRTVLEIGPGSGMLTNALADAGFRVIAIEKDARLFRALRERLIGRTNVECHQGDFLQFSFPDEDFSIVANLPFNITAATMRRITSAANPPCDAFLIVQLEAARKFAGVPRETLASLLLKPQSAASIPRLFRRADFDPVPRARPALLHLHRRADPLLTERPLAEYRRFVSAAFGSSDTIGGALRQHFTQRQVLRLARDGGFQRTARVSTLTFPQWLAIFRYYEHACMGRDPTMTHELPTAAAPFYNGHHRVLPATATAARQRTMEQLPWSSNG